MYLIKPAADVVNAPSVEYINSIAKTIADLGVTIVICAVILIFLTRILNTMVNHVNTTYESILPKIETINDAITDSQNAIISAITGHNTSSNTKLYELRSDVNKAQADLEKLSNAIFEMNAQLQRLDSNIDSNQKLIIQLVGEDHDDDEKK